MSKRKSIFLVTIILMVFATVLPSTFAQDNPNYYYPLGLYYIDQNTGYLKVADVDTLELETLSEQGQYFDFQVTHAGLFGFSGTARSFNVTWRGEEILQSVDAFVANSEMLLFENDDTLFWKYHHIDGDYIELPFPAGFRITAPEYGVIIAQYRLGDTTIDFIDLWDQEIIYSFYVEGLKTFTFGEDFTQWAITTDTELIVNGQTVRTTRANQVTDDLVFCGDILYFSSNTAGNNNIYKYEAGETTQMTFNNADDIKPVCGPDNRLFFLSDRGRNSQFGFNHTLYELIDPNLPAVEIDIPTRWDMYSTFSNRKDTNLQFHVALG